MTKIFTSIGFFLDSVETFILNYSRRILTAIILIGLIIGTLMVSSGIINLADSPNVVAEDVFKVPEFEKPKDTNKSSDLDSAKEPADEDKELYVHPMPEYKKEMRNIVENIMILNAVFANAAVNEFNYNLFTDRLANKLLPYKKVLSEDQFEETVEGLEDYVDDKMVWLRKGLKSRSIVLPKKVQIDSNNKQEKDRIATTFMNIPYAQYLEGVSTAYTEHFEKVEEAALVSSMNNMGAYVTLMIAGITFGVIVSLILLLLLFKAENSLRRSADFMEREK